MKMVSEMIGKLCALHIVEGLREGLSQFSGSSRASIVYVVKPEDPIHIYDPQNLLQGHELRLKELYLNSDEWRKKTHNTKKIKGFREFFPEKNLGLAGLISFGGRSLSIFYQMLFTEHHPDMCSTGPTERWLEHGAWLLSHDVVNESAWYQGTSGCVLREYSTHAVRDYIVDEMDLTLCMDTHMRIYPILDAVLGISRTLEEGTRARGRLVFIEPRFLPVVKFLARFQDSERPGLNNLKHVRKLLQAVENSDRCLVSDGKCIIGIGAGELPEYQIAADFRGIHGFLLLNGNPVCSFFDGCFHSSTRRARLVQLEEFLIDSGIDDPLSDRHSLFKIISEIVNSAGDRKHGCTLVIDLNDQPLEISGQHLEEPPDIRNEKFLELAKSLSILDGALHIRADMKLHGFACILDGRTIPGEDRARGARFNSALRFTAEHNKVVVVVVSADRPVSVIQEGVELNARCEWQPVSSRVPTPPTLEEWLNRPSVI